MPDVVPSSSRQSPSRRSTRPLQKRSSYSMTRRGENLSGVSPIQDSLRDASQIGVSLSRANLRRCRIPKGQNGGPARKRGRKLGVFSGVRPLTVAATS
jgi:hypothetical protein